MKRQTYDPEKFQLDLARLKTHGDCFEVAVDADNAILYREGIPVEISDIVKSEKIFSDVQKGLLASETKCKAVFNTTVFLDIAKIILDKGDIQITAEKRKKEIEKKKRRIISQLQKYGVDPRTNVPHTIARIENAVIESKVHIDEFKPVETQVKEILKKIQVLLPIRLETKKIAVHVPPRYAGNVQSYLTKVGVLSKQSWGHDQSFSAEIEIPGGLEDEFYDKINGLSHGTVTTRLVEINKSKL